AGPDRVDLVEGDQQVGAAQVGAAEVVAFVGGQLPAAWQSALERGGVGVEGERGPRGGDPVGVVQVHAGLLWLVVVLELVASPQGHQVVDTTKRGKKSGGHNASRQ